MTKNLMPLLNSHDVTPRLVAGTLGSIVAFGALVAVLLQAPCEASDASEWNASVPLEVGATDAPLLCNHNSKEVGS